MRKMCFALLALLLLLILSSSEAFAVREIVVPGPIGSEAVLVPTLTEWGMIITSILFGLSAIWFLKMRRKV